MRLRCGTLSITMPVSLLANEFEKVSLATVNHICVINEAINGCENIKSGFIKGLLRKCKYVTFSTLCSCLLVILHGVFKINFFEKLSQESVPSECQTVWAQIRPDVLSGLIWVQTICKGYQQKTLL